MKAKRASKPPARPAPAALLHGVTAHVPKRPWARVSALVRLVATTGLVLDQIARKRVEPVSLLITGPPGTGKTECLKRFKANAALAFRDDLTWMGLIDLLQLSHRGAISHVVFPELNKVLDRRDDVWQNCMSLLGQAIEDGVYQAQVGKQKISLDGTRIGMIAGITGDSWENIREYFKSKGLASRILVVKWEESQRDDRRVMQRSGRGELGDLRPVHLPRVDDPPVTIRIPQNVADALEAFVMQNYLHDRKRRFFQFRAMVCAAAVLRIGAGARVVTPADWRYVMAFRDVWKHEEIGK